MKTLTLKLITLCSLLITPFIVNATDGGIIEAMQMPSWIKRDGVIQPLKPGTTIHSGDIVSTGQSARILIRLEEGSLIKLGENGELDLGTIQPPEKTRGHLYRPTESRNRCLSLYHDQPQ